MLETTVESGSNSILNFIIYVVGVLHSKKYFVFKIKTKNITKVTRDIYKLYSKREKTR